MRVKMNFSKITKNHLTDSETFFRKFTTINGRIKDCYEVESNSREIADQPRDLTTKPTILGSQSELLY